MKKDKNHDEKVRLAGWTAGATEKDKNTNPYRDQKNDDEYNWDKAWDQGFAGQDFSIWD
jgi:hypothetical protein